MKSETRRAGQAPTVGVNGSSLSHPDAVQPRMLAPNPLAAMTPAHKALGCPSDVTSCISDVTSCTASDATEQAEQDKQQHQTQAEQDKRLEPAPAGRGPPSARDKCCALRAPAGLYDHLEIKLPQEIKAIILSMVLFKWQAEDMREALARHVMPVHSRLHLFHLEIVEDIDCEFKNSRGTKQPGKFSGALERGNPHGRGHWTADMATHGTYEGEFVCGVANGNGRRDWPTGGSYEGDFVDAQKHGHGVETWPTGGCYEGGWVDNKRHGTGQEQWPAGGSYTGDWVEGKRHGIGEEVWPTGGSYRGQYHQGKKHGWGVERWPTSGWYAGNYVTGRRKGYGEEFYPAKTAPVAKPAKKYEGEYGDNTRNGLGVMVYADGSESKVGMWRKGKFRYRCTLPLMSPDVSFREDPPDGPDADQGLAGSMGALALGNYPTLPDSDAGNSGPASVAAADGRTQY